MPRVSKIWDYFIVNPEDVTRAQCTICKIRVARGGKCSKDFTITNLKSHLQHNHKLKFMEYEEKQKLVDAEKKRSKNDSTTSKIKSTYQSQLEGIVDKMTPFSPTDPRTVSLNEKLTEMIAIDIQPFSIVEDVGFQRFVSALNPRYKLPSRSYISDELLPSMYERVKKAVSVELESMNTISLTTDVWSTKHGSHSLISLTGHWISETFQRKACDLHASSFVGSHTGEAIASVMDKMLSVWDINKKNIVTVLRDNAANALCGMNQAGVDSLGCFTHSLQLCVKDVIDSQRSVNDTLAICRGIAGHFNMSPLANSRLVEIQKARGMKQHKIFQDVKTRWNSTYYMLQRIVEQKQALVQFASDYELPVLTVNQWKLAEILIKTLERFEILTKQASSSSASVSLIIPSVQMLQHSISKHDDDQGIQTMTGLLSDSLKKRFADIENNKLCVISTFIDPRFKSLFFVNSCTESKAIDWIKDEIRVNHVTECERPQQTKTEDSDPDSKKQKLDPFKSAYEELLMKKGADLFLSQDNSSPNADREIRNFLMEPIHARESCPLDWWKINRSRYPMLANIARKYLGPPASSVPSERLFSEAGLVYDDRRSNLKPEKAEMILMTRGNMALLKFVY